LSLLLRVAAASIGFCCPTGFRSFIVHPNKSEARGGRRLPPCVNKTHYVADGSLGTELFCGTGVGALQADRNVGVTPRCA
jgi:hypothetical protein